VFNKKSKLKSMRPQKALNSNIYKGKNVKHLVFNNLVFNKSGGFTLIETLIYIAIIGIVITSFVEFSISVSNSRGKAYVASEVQSNLRVSMDLIRQRIREATDVTTSSSTFGSDPSFLTLTMASSTLNPTTIGLSADNGVLGIKEGSNATTTITSSEVSVTNLVFTNLTASTTRENIRIQMTIEYNGGGDVYYEFSQSAQSAVSLRQ
jgi:type II secretory pathway pseudopilin PulG